MAELGGGVAAEGFDDVLEGFSKLVVDGPEQGGEAGDVAVGLDGVADDFVEVGAAADLVEVVDHVGELLFELVNYGVVGVFPGGCFGFGKGAGAEAGGGQAVADFVADVDADGLVGVGEDVFAKWHNDRLDAALTGGLHDVGGEFDEGGQAQGGDGAGNEGFDDDVVVDVVGQGFAVGEVGAEEVFGFAMDLDGFAGAAEAREAHGNCADFGWGGGEFEEVDEAAGDSGALFFDEVCLDVFEDGMVVTFHEPGAGGAENGQVDALVESGGGGVFLQGGDVGAEVVGDEAALEVFEEVGVGFDDDDAVCARVDDVDEGGCLPADEGDAQGVVVLGEDCVDGAFHGVAAVGIEYSGKFKAGNQGVRSLAHECLRRCGVSSHCYVDACL